MSPKDFPSRVLWWQVGATVAASLFFVMSMVWEYEHTWSFGERYYLPHLVRANTLGRLYPAPLRYRLLTMVDSQGAEHLAPGNEIEATTLKDGRPGYRLTEEGRQEGAVKLEFFDQNVDSAWVRTRLQEDVYNRAVWDYIEYPVYIALAVWVLGLLVAVPRDRERQRIRREGIRIDGPELVTAEEFNRRVQGDGVGIDHVQKSWIKRLFGKAVIQIRIARDQENQHFTVMGDSGTGKSGPIRQLLLQIWERGESAIIYDPAMEYVSQFYCEERGDVILNPLDARCPFWTPGDEVPCDSEALTVATSLFPRESTDGKEFFEKACRRVFAELVKRKLSPEELIHCLCHEEELDRLVRGTPVQAMISGKGEQRAGVWGSLNMVGESLMLLPRAQETKRRWSAAEWAKNRKGWIFITTKASSGESIQPLISMWLDLLILRMINEGRSTKTAAWFVLDEVADLEHLPQLHKAMTQNRKSNCPMVLGFQGKDQIEMFYGKLGKPILSQAETRIYLKTKEPDSAKWISKALGEMVVERLRETRTTGPDGRRTVSESVEQKPDVPVVSYTKIMGLSKHQGFLKYGNFVVALNTPYIDLEDRCEKFIERPARARAAAAGSSSPNPSVPPTPLMFE